MKKKPSLLLFTILLSLPFFGVAQSLNFSQAWTHLVYVSNNLHASNLEVEKAKEQVDASKDLNFPAINLVGSYTHLSDPIQLNDQKINIANPLSPSTNIAIPIPSIALTEQDIFRSSLQAMWPIYTGGKITAAQSITKDKVQEKKANEDIEKSKLFVQLVDRYYAVAVTKVLVKTHQQLLSALEKHASHAKKLESQGQIAKVERLNAQVALANERIAVSRAKRQAEMAQIALAQMLHKKQVETSSPMFELNSELSFTEISKKTIANHPALRLLKSKEEQAQDLINIEKSGYYPTVFLYGNYTLYKDDSLFSQAEPDWLVGVGVKIPLLSRNGRSGKVEAAKNAQLQARYTRAQTQQDLNLLLEKNYRDLLQAQDEISALNLSIKLATENERLRSLAFRQGLSTSIDIVDAELKLTAAKTKQLAEKYHYIQAYARLMSMSSQINQFITQSRHKDI
ncbi:MAG: TolC family protein [Psychromonas sp.]|nr:TolC family protein [Psychromonas sp.]